MQHRVNALELKREIAFVLGDDKAASYWDALRVQLIN